MGVRHAQGTWPLSRRFAALAALAVAKSARTGRGASGRHRRHTCRSVAGKAHRKRAGVVARNRSDCAIFRSRACGGDVDDERHLRRPRRRENAPRSQDLLAALAALVFSLFSFARHAVAPARVPRTEGYAIEKPPSSISPGARTAPPEIHSGFPTHSIFPPATTTPSPSLHATIGLAVPVL
jgi:hypothetical protein